ncbi:cobalamin biosynthesis protein CbiX [uncultured Shimia sp.]|uniref:sirohydrochlorin chelatase n=1 Tax=uncultured Shimia sp. TaxID=573152 RepID=UPI0025D41A47|nr:cobalamin biosynthesis protein CbiX [uncultured Shimia sp.]
MSQLDALIVAHGQPSAQDAAEGALASFLAEIEPHAPSCSLGAATLAAPGKLEHQLERLRPGGLIYPLFMSEGWFVKSNLAKRLGAAPVQVMTPFGMDDALISLTAKALQATAGFGKGPLLLVAHGSASGRKAPAQVPLDFGKRLSDALEGYPVHVGFIEQEPLISDVARMVPDAGLCLPFFAMEGDHVQSDVRDALKGAGFVGEILPAISRLPGMSQRIAESIQAELGNNSQVSAA